MTVSDLALLILRIGIGLTFAAHGVQKAFGWWNGPGPAGWSGAMSKMGFAPVGLFAVLSTANELIGGPLLALGLLTPLVAAVLIAQSIVIIAAVHWRNGFFAANGGIEFPLALGIGATAVCLSGPGGYSLDAAVGIALTDGARILLTVLGMGVGLVTQAYPRFATYARRTEEPEAAPRLRRG